jgi:hypothetical protein
MRQQTMTSQKLHTVWFTELSKLMIAIGVPLWAIGAVAWGSLMAFFMHGSVIGWMIAGVFWGVSCWLFTSLFWLVALRRLVVRLSPLDTSDLHQRLVRAVEPLKCCVEQPSEFQYVCTPTRGWAGLRKFNAVRVQQHKAGIDLIGPALLVKKVQKHLLAA